MLIAIDVFYQSTIAHVAGGLFASWSDTEFARVSMCRCQDVQPYEPGSFYQRELPCLLALLEKISDPVSTIIIDGYVTLGAERRAGLGAHLFNALQQRIPVIGVAKTRFRDTPEECAVYRGGSANPLYITTAGIPLADAKEHIVAMAGEHRFPTLLKEIDRLSRQL